MAVIQTVRLSGALIYNLMLQIKQQTGALTKDIPPANGSRFTQTHRHTDTYKYAHTHTQYSESR